MNPIDFSATSQYRARMFTLGPIPRMQNRLYIGGNACIRAGVN